MTAHRNNPMQSTEAYVVALALARGRLRDSLLAKIETREQKQRYIQNKLQTMFRKQIIAKRMRQKGNAKLLTALETGGMPYELQIEPKHWTSDAGTYAARVTLQIEDQAPIDKGEVTIRATVAQARAANKLSRDYKALDAEINDLRLTAKRLAMNGAVEVETAYQLLLERDPQAQTLLNKLAARMVAALAQDKT